MGTDTRATLLTMTTLLIGGLAATTPVAIAAQASFTQLTQDMREREYAEIRGKMLAAANKMPADAYDYRAVPEVRSFGEEINHAADVNFRLCGMAQGTADGPPPRPAGTPPEPPTAKAGIVDRLTKSLELCDESFEGLTDAAALEPTFGRYVRGSHVTAMLGHTWHVYGKLTLLMRLNGIAP